MDKIEAIVAKHFPGKTITHISDKGFWLDEEAYKISQQERGEDWRGRRIVKFRLDDGTGYCLKLSDPNNDWESEFVGEISFYRLLSNTTIPVPKIIAVDLSKELTESNYIIITELSGVKLHTLWLQCNQVEKKDIYRKIGETYSQINSIPGRKSGLPMTTDDPYETRFPIHPSEFYLENEIRKGSGLKLNRQNILDSNLYSKIINLWERNLDYLKNNRPVLVHLSAFCWNISLEFNDTWVVSRLTGCSDIVWWDYYVNLALFKYPPFMKISPEYWAAFLEGYGVGPDEKKIGLYGLLIKLLAATGTFYEPKELKNKYLFRTLNSELKELIEQIGDI